MLTFAKEQFFDWFCQGDCLLAKCRHWDWSRDKCKEWIDGPLGAVTVNLLPAACVCAEAANVSQGYG